MGFPGPHSRSNLLPAEGPKKEREAFSISLPLLPASLSCSFSLVCRAASYPLPSWPSHIPGLALPFDHGPPSYCLAPGLVLRWVGVLSISLGFLHLLALIVWVSQAPGMVWAARPGSSQGWALGPDSFSLWMHVSLDLAMLRIRCIDVASCEICYQIRIVHTVHDLIRHMNNTVWG